MIKIEKIKTERIKRAIKNETKTNYISFFRLLFFLGFFIEVFRGLFVKSKTEFFLGIIFLLIFIYLVILSNKCINNIDFDKNIIEICNQILKITKNNLNSKDENDTNHEYCLDLDILGNNSLYDKINICQTENGKSRLKCFLKNTLKNQNLIIQRQKSVQEFSNKIEWCVSFLSTAKSININNLNFSLNYFNNKSLSLILKIVPIFNIIIIIFFFCFPKTILANTVILVIPIILYFILKRKYNKLILKKHSLFEFTANELEKLSSLLILIENEKFESGNNIFLKKTLFFKQKYASQRIKELTTLLHAFEGINFLLLGGILKVVFLWELRYGLKIGKFIEENKKEISTWFETISEFEALISFGIYSYKNEDFIYPSCSENSNVIEIKNISHPLISKNERVYNDFLINRKNAVQIITGANMTGKSTFLRSVGINMVLAMNGCPVCATTFNFYPISIFTSMRTNDSLSEGSSYFNAEIQRLKLLIEKLENNEPQFIILDEILKGTNSLDKLKGSELFLEKLMKQKTKMNCLIATHDIDLTKMENDYPNNITNYCFELHNNNGELEPDYKLQKGVTKSMNAIDLMRKNNIID